MRMTSQRKAILAFLEAKRQPQSAEMIHVGLSEQAMNLSTVYRTLDAFFASGLISKSTLNNTTYYYLNQKEHHHYMICLRCHRMFEIDCHIHYIEDQIRKQHDFSITHHDLTIYGYCSSCRKDMKKDRT
ncbi:MAG: Fur family transcriptional regulator [Acholeplasmataceae bacterium]